MPAAKNRFAIIPLRENVDDNEDPMKDELQEANEDGDADDITEEDSNESCSSSDEE